MKTSSVSCLIISGFVLSLAGCGAMDTSGGKMTAEKSLYDRLGGKPAIEAVVTDFLDRLGADTRIHNPKVKARLAAIHVPSLKVQLVNLLCEATGGSCKYGGRDMKMAHAGLDITNAEFDAVVDDLVATLNTFKVGSREQQEILKLLGPMRTDIVEKPMAAMR